MLLLRISISISYLKQYNCMQTNEKELVTWNHVIVCIL